MREYGVSWTGMLYYFEKVNRYFLTRSIIIYFVAPQLSDVYFLTLTTNPENWNMLHILVFNLLYSCMYILIFYPFFISHLLGVIFQFLISGTYTCRSMYTHFMNQSRECINTCIEGFFQTSQYILKYYFFK